MGRGEPEPRRKLDDRRPEADDPEPLPQADARPDPRALDAAVSGDVPPPEPGMAGESAPGEPSRAEVFALAPELAGEEGAAMPGTPTRPLPPGAAGDVPRPTPTIGVEDRPGGPPRVDEAEKQPSREDRDGR